MGLYLSLNLTPTIAADQWDRFWCDSLQILREFPLRLVRPSEHKTPYGAQKIWTDILTATDKNGEYWEIVGDAESLLFCEPVRLYRSIEYYQKQWNRRKPKKRLPNDDPLFCISKDFTKAEEEFDDHVRLSGVELFHSRTQGYPYHHAIVAVASLAEHYFPLHALAWCDLRPGGCDAVRQWLSSLFNEDISSPICLDAARLWNRIEGACGDISTTMKRFEERFLGTRTQEIHRMLAESRETTMQHLAAELLYYNTITLGFVDLSKSFLAATDDLDLFLDLIDLRNSLVSGKKAQEYEDERLPIPLEDVLKMLVGAFVTYSQWQGEEIRTLRRWVELEGGIVQTINATLLKMSLPDFFDFYCSENDLLETFVRREPAKQKKFKQVLRATLGKNAESEEMIKDFVQTAQERAESKAKDSEIFFDESEDNFVRFLKGEVVIQSELKEPLTEKNVANLGRYFGYYANQIQQMVSGMEMENGDFLNDSTGKRQRDTLLAILHQNDVRLLEEAMLAIERTDEAEMLKFFAILAPFLFAGQFHTAGPIIFGEAFTRVRPALWHLLNRPTWWITLREHLNDGVTGDEIEI